MQMNKPVSTTTILDTRRAKQNGLYPIKVRITFERKQRYYSLPRKYDSTKENFKRIMFGERLSTEAKEFKLKIGDFEKKAIEIIDSMPLFTWHIFEKLYHTDRITKDTVTLAFEDYVKQLKASGRIGTAVSYECSQKSLNKFSSETKFIDISPDFLQRYEKWMLEEGNSITTVGIYLRSLRTLFNILINDGTLAKEYYPFGKRKYEIPTSNNIKKSLTLKDIEAIYKYKPEPGSMTERSRDYWFFIYLCNGINVKDLCLLRYDNIKGDVLDFERSKTARTKRNIEPIRIPLADEAKTIIKRWGNKRKDGSTYIFPILRNGLSPERERQLIQQFTHLINDHMKAIAGKLEITKNITTYTARHSFATILKRSGASTEFISEALGHSSVRTTQNYLARFEDESKKEKLKALTAF